MTYQDAIKKVSALMAKANATEFSEEASTFMAGAQQIIDKYNLDVNDINYDKREDDHDNEEVRDFGYTDPLADLGCRDYRADWGLRLANLVAFHNACAARWVKNNGRNIRDGIKIRVIGRPSDVEVTRYLYSFFMRQVNELILKHCKGQSSKYKGEFAVGCISTLSNKIDAQKKETITEVKAENTGNAMALIRIDKAVARIEKRREDLDDFFMRGTYEYLAEKIGVTSQVAKLFFQCRREEAKKLFTTEELWMAAVDAHKAYLEGQRKVYKGICRGRGPKGFSGAGSQGASGGYEAGRKAGESIRLTSAKAGLGGIT